MKITKDTLLIDALKGANGQEIAEVLYSFGMPCLGCVLANNENIEEAAMAHGIDIDELLQALNDACSD